MVLYVVHTCTENIPVTTIVREACSATIGGQTVYGLPAYTDAHRPALAGEHLYTLGVHRPSGLQWLLSMLPAQWLLLVYFQYKCGQRTEPCLRAFNTSVDSKVLLSPLSWRSFVRKT